MNPKRLVIVLFLIATGTGRRQTNSQDVTEALQRQVQLHRTGAHQLQQYLFKGIPNLPTLRKAGTTADKLRS